MSDSEALGKVPDAQKQKHVSESKALEKVPDCLQHNFIKPQGKMRVEGELTTASTIKTASASTMKTASASTMNTTTASTNQTLASNEKKNTLVCITISFIIS